MTQAGRPLTYLQQRFVDAYLSEAAGNATKAAQLAGYQGTYDSLRQIGSQNLRNPRIRTIIDEEFAKIRKRLKERAPGIWGY